MEYSCDECLIEDGTNLIKCSDNMVMYVCDKCLNSFVKEDYKIIKCSCGSVNIIANQNSSEDRPHILLTEYNCSECKSYWYDED